MADTKIASLTDGTSTSATDRIPVAISPYGSGNNAYITPAYLKTFMVTGGTVTTSTPVFDMTQTWNAGAQAFTGLKLNVTDTASASSSMLFDAQAGSVSQFYVRKNGVIVATTRYEAGGSSGSPGGVLGDNVSMMSTSTLGWTNTSSALNTVDTVLRRDAANTLALQNGTSAQAFNVYNTWSSAGANYERLALKWSSNVAIIGTEAGGTGSSRTLQLLSATSLIQICGTSAAFPALKRNGGNLEVRAADDSGFAVLQCAGIIANGDLVVGIANKVRFGGGGGRTDVSSPADGSILFRNNAGTDFDRLQLGGSTASFPAIKRSTTSLQVRLADDSAFTAIQGKLTTDTAYTATPQTCSGYITIYDSTGTPYKVMVST